jgi:hypothetical protein
MPPLKLTDAELDAVFNAARPLAPNVREDFLKEVADRLSSYPTVGPGTVHRVCLEMQRRFFDPPDLGGWAATKTTVSPSAAVTMTITPPRIE